MSVPESESAALVASPEPLSKFDFRLRSLDRRPGEPINLCSACGSPASWSVWLHTPEWGPQGGATYVLCTMDALHTVAAETGRAMRRRTRRPGSHE